MHEDTLRRFLLFTLSAAAAAGSFYLAFRYLLPWCLPFLLALLKFNSVVVASALSLIASLGDLMPPTALAGIFAAQVVDEPNFFKVLKLCLIPGVLVAAWGIAVIFLSGPIAKLIF